MTLAFKRMYVDIPTETHDKLKALAVKRGMSQKGLLAELIEQACARKTVRKPARKTVRRKVKKKAKKRAKSRRR